MFIKEKLRLSDAMLAVTFGIAIGPYGFQLLNASDFIHDENEFLKHITRILICVQVMAAGVSLPAKYLFKEWKSLGMLLGPALLYTWLSIAFFAWLILGFPILEAMILSACVSPTDPILANSIVKGRFAEKNVPQHVRLLLSAESGANDGLGFPFLFIAYNLLTFKSTSDALLSWFFDIIIYQIVVSILIGTITGYIARIVLRYADRNGLIDKENFLSFAILFALFLCGSVGMIGSDDILACFIAGNVLTNDDYFRIETMNTHVEDVIDNILNLCYFMIFGLIIQWGTYLNSATSVSRLIMFALAVMIFKRLPFFMAIYKFIPQIKSVQEALFSGWFGPIGSSAIFYATVVNDLLPKNNTIAPTVYFLVLSSIFIHGITLPVLLVKKKVVRKAMSLRDSQSSVRNHDKISIQIENEEVIQVLENDGDGVGNSGRGGTTIDTFGMTESNTYVQIPPRTHSIKPILSGKPH